MSNKMKDTYIGNIERLSKLNKVVAAQGVKTASDEQFIGKMQNEETRQQFYNYLVDSGLDVGSYEKFLVDFGFSSSPQSEQRVEQKPDVVAMDTTSMLIPAREANAGDTAEEYELDKEALKSYVPQFKAEIKEKFPNARLSGFTKPVQLGGPGMSYVGEDAFLKLEDRAAKNSLSEDLKLGKIDKQQYESGLQAINQRAIDRYNQQFGDDALNASAALHLMTKAQNRIKTVESRGKSKIGNMFRGLKYADYAGINPALQVIDAYSSYSLLSKLAENPNAELSGSEEYLLQAIVTNNAVDDTFQTTMAERIGAGLPPNMAYMAGYALTGGVGSAVGGATKSVAKKLIKKGMKNAERRLYAKGFKGLVQKVGDRALNTVIPGVTNATVAAATQTVLDPLGVTAEALERKAGTAEYSTTEFGIPVATGEVVGQQKDGAWRDAFISKWVENVSERSGASLAMGLGGVKAVAKPVGKAVGNIDAVKKIADGFTDLTSFVKSTKIGNLIGQIGSFLEAKNLNIQQLAKAVGWNGTVEEFYEEQVNTILNAWLVGDEEMSALLDSERQLETFLSVGVVGTAMRLMDAPAAVTQRAEVRQEKQTLKRSLANIEKAHNSQSGREALAAIADAVDNGSLSDVATTLANLNRQRHLDEQTAQDYVSYATARTLLNMWRSNDMRQASGITQDIYEQVEARTNKQSGAILVAEYTDDQGNTQMVDVVDGVVIRNADKVDSTLSDRSVVVCMTDGTTKMVSSKSLGAIVKELNPELYKANLIQAKTDALEKTFKAEYVSSTNSHGVHYYEDGTLDYYNATPSQIALSLCDEMGSATEALAYAQQNYISLAEAAKTSAEGGEGLTLEAQNMASKWGAVSELLGQWSTSEAESGVALPSGAFMSEEDAAAVGNNLRSGDRVRLSVDNGEIVDATIGGRTMDGNLIVDFDEAVTVADQAGLSLELTPEVVSAMLFVEQIQDGQEALQEEDSPIQSEEADSKDYFLSKIPIGPNGRNWEAAKPYDAAMAVMVENGSDFDAAINHAQQLATNATNAIAELTSSELKVEDPTNSDMVTIAQKERAEQIASLQHTADFWSGILEILNTGKERYETRASEETSELEEEMPKLQDGNPDFISAGPIRTAEYLTATLEEDAESFIQDNITESQKVLEEALEKRSTSTDFTQRKKERDAIAQEREAAQARLDFWKAVADIWQTQPTAELEEVTATQPEPVAGDRGNIEEKDARARGYRHVSGHKITGNLRPEEITSSVTAYPGAPTVNARGEDRASQSEEDATEINLSSMSANEAIDFVADMELIADVAPEIELTIENWDVLFGESGTINTPIGEVKMGENQFAKLMRQGRDGKLGMIKPTLENPHAIVEEASEAKEGDTTERASSYIFIRSFKRADGSRFFYITSITVSKDGREVVVSSQEKSRNKILRLLQEGSVIWRTPKDATTSSAERQGLDYEQPNEAETATKGSGITPQSTSSDGKDTTNLPNANELGEKIAKAEAEVNTNPTEKQKEAGNYKKGHVQIGTFNVTIEQPKGSVRSGVDKDGKKWEVEMQNTYGYIRGTEGVDGDHIDVFVSDDIDGWNGRLVFVVDQRNADGPFDEHKVMLGFNDINDAEAAYLSNYEDGWQGLGAITGVAIEDFEKWIASSHRKTKAFAEYKSVKTAEGQSASADKDLRRKLADFNVGDVVRDYYNQKLYRIKKHSTNGVSTIAELDAEGNEVGTTTMNAHNNSRYSLAETPLKAETTSTDAPYTIAPAQYTTKRGKVLDMLLVKFSDEIPKNIAKVASSYAKEMKGWWDKSQGGFMMRNEEDAKRLAEYVVDAQAQEPVTLEKVSMDDVKAVNDGNVLFTEPRQPKAESKDDEYRPVWQYSIHVDADGYTTLSRDDVSGVYPIGDARFRQSANSPEEMLEILRNPYNGMQEILEAVGVTLENEIKTRELDRKVKEERKREYESLRANGYNGYKIGEEVVYKGKKAKIYDLEEFGEHRPVLDTGLAPVMYEVAEWGDISKVGAAHKVNVENLIGELDKKGEAKLSDHVEQPANPSGNRLVTDERYAELRERMRKKLGGQMNIGIDPEILAIGTEMAVYHLEKGARKFTEYAKAMIADLGDAIRPYLKAFYNGARNLPEVESSEIAADMTPYDEVQTFDVANFDKPSIDALATAETVAREAEVEQEVEIAQERIKKSRSPRKKSDKKAVNLQKEQLNIIDNGTAEENTSADNSGTQPGREELSSTEQVGAGASVQYPARDSRRKRRDAGNGGSESGNRPQYDVTKDYSNEEIEEIVSSVTDVIDSKVVITGQVTDEIKSICRQYQSGGVAKKGRGILDEYYTDGKIVDAVNMLIAPYFNNTTPARVLEPSVGIGNFIEAINNISTSEVVAFEINETTARIAKVLYPNVNVNLRSFETEFIDESGNKKPLPQGYNLVIGNPPYGSHRGLYKGLGEESKISRYEDYFVKRSLDVLDEGGVLAMVLPSSWMDRHTKYGGYTIERAYRLPSGAFEATQVGTDIVILKKDNAVPVTEHAPYFEQHPERVLGEVKERTGRYGRSEQYVEGDIDAAIEAIKKENAEQVADLLNVEKDNDILNNIESAIDETGSAERAVAVVKDAQDSEKADTKPAIKPSNKQNKYKVELNRGAETVPTSTQFTHEFSEGEVEAFADTDYEGALTNPTKHRRFANYIGGQAIHDFYYAEGDIYSKLVQLEREKDRIVENYGAEQYEKQKALLESVQPKQKRLEEITISPNTAFVKNLNILTEDGMVSLRDMFVDFCRKLPYQAFGDSSSWEVIGFVNNEQVHGTDKQRNQLVRERRKRVAHDMFNKFLNEELSDNAKKQVVAAFNREYNSTYRPDYSKVPMFSTINRDFKGKPLKLTSVQLAGIGRMTVKGVGVLAHEVGFGKTLSGVLAMHEAMTRGFAEKPLIVVPNDNILKQWVETIGEVLPNATVNTLGNLGVGYDLTDFKVNAGEFTIITYEGLKAMSFSDGTYNHLASKFSYITEDLNKHWSERDFQKEIEKKNELKGKMKRGTKSSYMFEDFGFDWLTVDEVHNANHIVSKVRLDKSVASDFRSLSQRTSDLGLKTWLAAQYIQEENNGRNVLLLSATPFTNKPLEYYSILSLVANDMLERKGFFNVDQFFATFMEADNELEIGANGRPMQKTNVRRFRNNGLFQQLLSEFIDIKGEEDNPELVRPERFNKEYKIAQNELTVEAMVAAQELLSDNDTVLQGIGHARAAAFSPYATSLLGMQPKNHKEFVKNSPKIDATIKMIETNIKDRPDAGQIIYSEVGVEYFPLIRDYLVKESGLKPTEVRIITGATSNNERVNIQTAFNNGEVKVVIGSPAIKEGLNLQGNTTDMYILSLPWNFTQLRQIEGRGWRQGNKWENIRINYMLTNDSVDVFMLQRLQLKQGLYNEAMKSGAESLDVSDIDTAELKTALITDPAVRAEIVTVQERAKLQQEKTQIEADLSFVMRKYEAYNKLVQKVESQKQTIKMYKSWAQQKDGDYWAQRVEREEVQLKSIENEIEQERLNLLKKGVNVEEIVRQTEQAQNSIAAIQEKIDNLENFQEELTQKYSEENEAKAKAKEQGDLVSTYIRERRAENKGGFYKIRPETNAVKEDAENINAAAEETPKSRLRFRTSDNSQRAQNATAEELDIIAKAKANGTYLKAPNGKPTNLSPKQWVLVRTNAFKKWFGDWEKAARIEKLRNSPSIIATGEEYIGKYELNNKSAAEYINNELRGSYTNKDTNESIKITRKGAFKVTRHDAENEVHLKSIALIPEMLENAIFITEESNDKRINDFESYRYYVVGVNMAGVEYTAKLVIGVKNGETYYDHSLTEIEKTNLIDRRDEISSSFTANEDAIFEYKDKRLISILQTNSSKVVDANGEPLVVYHYSNSPKISAFNPFRRANELTEEETEKIGKIRDAHSNGRSSLVKPFMGIWATPIRGEYADYGKYEYALFANIRNPRITDRVSPNLSGDKKSDGVFSYANGILTEVSSILPERFKSATDNAGTFDAGNPDIRYSSVSEDAYQRAIAAQAETLSSSEVEEYAKSLANIAPEGVRVVITNSSQTGDTEHAGWYDMSADIVYINADICANKAEVDATFIHEIVGHRQMPSAIRRLIGSRKAADRNTLYSQLFNLLPEMLKQQAALKFSQGVDLGVAVDEALAEAVENEGIIEPNLWQRICAAVRAFWRKVFNQDLLMSDNDIKYMFWLAAHNLNNKAEFLAAGEVRNRLAKKPVEIRTAAPTEEQREYDESIAAGAQQITEAWIDSLNPLKELQEVVAARHGELKSWENAYDIELGRASRTMARAQMMSDRFLKPVINALSTFTNNGTTLEEVTDYMIAKHGLERNEYFRKKEHLKLNSRILEVVKEYAQGDLKNLSVAAKIEGIRNDFDEYRDVLDTEVIEDALGWYAYANEEYMGRPVVPLESVPVEDNSGLTGLVQKRDPEAKAEDVFTEFAEDLVNEFEGRYINAVDVLWQAVRNLANATLLYQVDGGVISRELYSKLRSMYRYYIPLRGWAEDTSDIYYEYTSKASPYQTVVKGGKGRTSLADDPIANMANMLQSAVTIVEKNAAKQALVRMAMNRPNSDLLKVVRVRYKKERNATTGEIEWVPIYPKIPEKGEFDADILIENYYRETSEMVKSGEARVKRPQINVGVRVKPSNTREHYVIALFGGEEVAVLVNGNVAAAQALNGTNVPQYDKGLQETAGEVTRYYARVHTSLSPRFVVTNLIRDYSFASFAAYVKGPEYSKRFQSNWWRGKGLWKKLQDGTINLTAAQLDDYSQISDQTLRYFIEFLTNGGETGFSRSLATDQWKKEIANQLDGLKGKNPKKVVDSVLGLLANANRWAEANTRFAAYITSREMGKNVAESIKDAKEITVNFSRHGSGRMGNSVVRSLYAYTNAGIQGTYNFMVKLAKENPKRFWKAVGTVFLTGFAVPLINLALLSLLGDDDDWRNYKYFSEYNHTNRLVIFTGKGFITLPISHELIPFYALGNIALRRIGGWALAKTTDKTLWASDMSVTEEVLGAIMSAVPLDFVSASVADGISLRNFVPTIFQPVVDVYKNLDFQGRPIYRSYDYGDGNTNWHDAGFTKAPIETWDWLVALSKGISDLTGGDGLISPGMSDFHISVSGDDVQLSNPAIAQYLLESYLGGAVQEATKIGNLVKGGIAYLQGNETDAERYLSSYNIPIINGLYRSSSDTSADSSIDQIYDYYKNDIARQCKREVDAYMRELPKNPEKWKPYVEKALNSEEWQIYTLYRDNDSFIRKAEKALWDAIGRKDPKKEIDALRDDIRAAKLRIIEKASDIRLRAGASWLKDNN